MKFIYLLGPIYFCLFLILHFIYMYTQSVLFIYIIKSRFVCRLSLFLVAEIIRREGVENLGGYLLL